MDIKLLKDITKLMNDNDLIEVDVETKALKLKLRKAAPIQPTMVHAVAAAAAPAIAAAPVALAAPVDEFAGCTKIISPIPGTVYLKPSPEASIFASVGTSVDETKVICLVEAMKVFNEIKPDPGVKGTIKKICVSDGQPVEYGTVMFLIG